MCTRSGFCCIITLLVIDLITTVAVFASMFRAPTMQLLGVDPNLKSTFNVTSTSAQGTIYVDIVATNSNFYQIGISSIYAQVYDQVDQSTVLGTGQVQSIVLPPQRNYTIVMPIVTNLSLVGLTALSNDLQTKCNATGIGSISVQAAAQVVVDLKITTANFPFQISGTLPCYFH